MLKKLKSLFIEEVGDAPEKGQTETPQAGEEQENDNAVTPPGMDVSLKVSEGKITGKFMDILFKAMEENNIDGFDYLEFKQSLKSLEKMPMDEQTRVKSAFAMAQTMNATPDRLIQTANHYLNVLNQEEKKFEEALAKQKAIQIGEKEQQLTQYEQAIKSKTEQIKILTEEIGKHQIDMDRIKQEVANAAVKVESTKNDFVASYNSVVSQIAKDIENMKRFLK